MQSDNSSPSLADRAAASERTRQRLADELRELLSTEQGLVDQLTDQLAEVRRRRDSYERALRLLTGEPAKPAKSAKSAKSAQAKYEWTVSDKKVSQVWEAVRGRDDPFTTIEVAKAAHASTEAVRRAIDTLRKRELVRLTAQRGTGGAKYYAVMPGAAEREASGAP